jgi:F0F1-type ATP synthase assembly protein I
LGFQILKEKAMDLVMDLSFGMVLGLVLGMALGILWVLAMDWAESAQESKQRRCNNQDCC